MLDGNKRDMYNNIVYQLRHFPVYRELLLEWWNKYVPGTFHVDGTDDTRRRVHFPSSMRKTKAVQNSSAMGRLQSIIDRRAAAAAVVAEVSRICASTNADMTLTHFLIARMA
jgi:hypothetical protein